MHANSRPATRSLQAASPVQRRDSVLGQTAQILVVSEHVVDRPDVTDSLLRKEGRAPRPRHQRPRHLRRRGRGVAGVGLRVYGDRLGRARLRRLRPDGPGRRHPRGQLPRRVAARRRPRGVEERLPQLYDLANDGRLSRAGGHGGAVGEERVVDVCVSVIYVRCRTYSGGDSGRDRGSALVFSLPSSARVSVMAQIPPSCQFWFSTITISSTKLAFCARLTEI